MRIIIKKTFFQRYFFSVRFDSKEEINLRECSMYQGRSLKIYRLKFVKEMAGGIKVIGHFSCKTRKREWTFFIGEKSR